MRTKYRVKVRPLKWNGGGAYRAECPACPWWSLPYKREWLNLCHLAASDHADRCQALHWANLDDACPSCLRYGRIAPACPVCLGRGWIAEREGLG